MARKQSGGSGKVTSDKMGTIASNAMRTGKATPTQIRAMGASLLSQDPNKGPNKR